MSNNRPTQSIHNTVSSRYGSVCSHGEKHRRSKGVTLKCTARSLCYNGRSNFYRNCMHLWFAAEKKKSPWSHKAHFLEYHHFQCSLLRAHCPVVSASKLILFHMFWKKGDYDGLYLTDAPKQSYSLYLKMIFDVVWNYKAVQMFLFCFLPLCHLINVKCFVVVVVFTNI